MNLKNEIEEGFTLIEIVVVMGIIGIISMILMPAYAQYVDKMKGSVCDRNCVSLGRLYDAELMYENKNHSDLVFEQFILGQDGVVCPSEGNVTYVDGEVICNVHCNEEENSDGEEIPIL